MLIHQEASEPVAEITGTLRQQQNEEVQKRDTVQETLPEVAAMETLSEVVLKDILAARRGRQLQAVLFIVPFAMMAAIPFFVTPANLVPFLGVLVGWLAVLFGNNFLLRRRGRRMAKLDDPRIAGALLDVFKSSGNFQGRDVNESLIRLLPRMKVSDAEGLSAGQRQFLYAILTLDRQWYSARYILGEDLKVAVLKALEQVGDEEALPIVTQMAQSEQNLKIRQAAKDCLPFLQIRVEEQRSRQLLLSSSAPSDFSNETLLRPSVENPEANAEELLLPASKET